MRATERHYSRTCCDAKSLWSSELQALRQLYEKKNCSYWRTEVAESKGNMKRLWRTLHGVLGEASNVDAGELTAEEFAVFFTYKVESVRASTASTPLYDVPSKATPTLEQWTAVTSDEVVKLIGSSLCKSCQLDCVSSCRRSSRCYSTHQSARRQWYVHCSRNTASMRANLPFLSKPLERIVQSRLQTFLDGNGLMRRHSRRTVSTTAPRLSLLRSITTC